MSALPMPARDVVADEAADWLVRLGSGAGRGDVEASLAAWLAADPLHARIWREMNGQLAPEIDCIKALERRSRGQAAIARRVLAPSMPPSRRKLLLGAFGLTVTAGGAGVLADRMLPLDGLGADFMTRTGQRRSLALADGSRLTLSARSAADVSYSGSERGVRLRRGALLASAKPGTRPFAVDTEAGLVRGNGARFLVEHHPQGERVAALSRGVHLESRGGVRLALREGEVAWMRRSVVDYAADDAQALAAWADGLLDVRDGTLGQVIGALRDWRPGLMRISDRAARLPVFGVFRLDDIDGALDQLAGGLPIAVSRFGGWLVSIDLR